MGKNYEWRSHFTLSKKIFNHLKESSRANNAETAAISRSIIHLAYYSCLNITKENNVKYGQDNQETGHGAHSHDISQIIHYKITPHTGVDLRKLRNNLLQLKAYRTRADYDSSATIDYYTVIEVMKRAEGIYNDLVILGEKKS